MGRLSIFTLISATRLLIVVVICGLQAGCGNDSRKDLENHTERAVKLAEVRFEPVNESVEVVGTLHGMEEATISAKVAGRLIENLVDVGDRVSPLAKLAQIDTTDYQLRVTQRKMSLNEASATLGLNHVPGPNFKVENVATVQKAKFQAANAKLKLDRVRQLLNEKPPLVSEQDFADVETSYEVAKRDYDVAVLQAESQVALTRSRASELKAAEQELADTAILAPPPSAIANATDKPYAVSARHVSPGELVREGTPIFDLVLDDPIKLRAAVPERFLGEVKLGQPAKIEVESYKQSFEGKVQRISPAINVQSRTFEVEVLLPNPERLLRSGAFARGKIVTGTNENVPFVPARALVTFAGVDRVYSVSDGKAKEHIVKTGEQRGESVAIIGNLRGVSKVITHATRELSDGLPVRIEE